MNNKDTHNITIERCTNANTSTTTLLEEMGVDFKLLVLKKDLVEANKNISRSLNIPIASYVYEIKRLLIVENVPKAIETSFVPMKIIPGFQTVDLENTSLYSILKEKYGIEIERSEEVITLEKATNIEKELLQTEDDEVLAINGTSSDRRGIIVESYNTVTVSDFFVFKSEM